MVSNGLINTECNGRIKGDEIRIERETQPLLIIVVTTFSEVSQLISSK
jgi:hypothetical protein